MSSATRVVKNTIFLYCRIAVNILIALYSTRLVLDALGVEDFGIYNLVAGSIAMLTFLNSAMAEATQRFMAYAHGEGNVEKQIKIFNVSAILHLLIALLIVLILELAGYFLFKGVLEIPEDRVKVAKLVYQFMIASTFFTILKVPFDAVLNSNENMFWVALLGIISSICRLGIAIYIVYTNLDSLVVYGLLMALLSIVMISTTMTYCYKKYQEVRFRLISHFDSKLFKEMTSFASWTLLSHSAWIIASQGTAVVLNSFFGVAINAAQGVANQVSGQLANLSNTMHNALNPVIIKSEGRKDRRKMLEASMFGNKISFFIIALFSIPLIIEMPYVLGLWLKDVPEFAVVFCRLSLIRLQVGAITHTFYVAIGAIGKIKKDAIWEALIFTSILPISYLAFQLGASPEAIYLTFIFAFVGISIVRVYFLNRLGGLSVAYFMKNSVLRCYAVFFSSFFIATIPLLFQNDGLLRFIIVLLASSFTFFITTFAFGLNKEENRQILNVVNRLTKNKIRAFSFKAKLARQ